MFRRFEASENVQVIMIRLVLCCVDINEPKDRPSSRFFGLGKVFKAEGLHQSVVENNIVFI